MTALTTVLGIAGALLALIAVGYVVAIYNGLVRLNRNIDEAWSNIDVLRKQRADELPKLIDTVEQYVEHERSVLQDLTEARAEAQQAASPGEAGDADSRLQGALGQLFAVAEDYPELQADENFRDLQNRISTIEEQIADRREFYNDAVNTYNIRINQVPHNVVANAAGYRERDLFEVDEADVQDIDVEEAFAA